MHNHAAALVDAFAAPARRERYLGLLRSAKGRAKLRSQLAHFRDFDPRHARLLPSAQHEPEVIAALLRSRGAPEDCHLISEADDLDGREMPLVEALRLIVGRGVGTFVSCLPGRLAYFEGEEPGDRYLLERPAV